MLNPKKYQDYIPPRCGYSHQELHVSRCSSKEEEKKKSRKRQQTKKKETKILSAKNHKVQTVFNTNIYKSIVPFGWPSLGVGQTFFSPQYVPSLCSLGCRAIIMKLTPSCAAHSTSTRFNSMQFIHYIAMQLLHSLTARGAVLNSSKHRPVGQIRVVRHKHTAMIMNWLLCAATRPHIIGVVFIS